MGHSCRTCQTTGLTNSRVARSVPQGALARALQFVSPTYDRLFSHLGHSCRLVGMVMSTSSQPPALFARGASIWTCQSPVHDHPVVFPSHYRVRPPHIHSPLRMTYVYIAAGPAIRPTAQPMFTYQLDRQLDRLPTLRFPPDICLPLIGASTWPPPAPFLSPNPHQVCNSFSTWLAHPRLDLLRWFFVPPSDPPINMAFNISVRASTYQANPHFCCFANSFTSA